MVAEIEEDVPDIGEGGEFVGEVTNADNIRQNLNFQNYQTVDVNLGLGLTAFRNLDLWAGGNLKRVFSISQPDFQSVLTSGSQGSQLRSKTWFVNPVIGLSYHVKGKIQLGVSHEFGSSHIYRDLNGIVQFDPLSYTNFQVLYNF